VSRQAHVDFPMLLLRAFGAVALALALAIIGVYGVVS
jgi:hypothetical protein